MPSHDASRIAAELTRLLDLAKRDVSREVLQMELEQLKSKLPPPVPAPIRVTPAASASTSKPFVSFPRYSWDQSDKWIKVYLTVDRISEVPDEQASSMLLPERWEFGSYRSCAIAHVQISASFEPNALCFEITM